MALSGSVSCPYCQVMHSSPAFTGSHCGVPRVCFMCMNKGCDVQKRKELTKGDFRTKHTNWGHLLLGIGVLIGVEGPVNTYLRAGETCPST